VIIPVFMAHCKEQPIHVQSGCSLLRQEDKNGTDSGKVNLVVALRIILEATL
jgi:hypothetical protein